MGYLCDYLRCVGNSEEWGVGKTWGLWPKKKESYANNSRQVYFTTTQHKKDKEKPLEFTSLQPPKLFYSSEESSQSAAGNRPELSHAARTGRNFPVGQSETEKSPRTFPRSPDRRKLSVPANQWPGIAPNFLTVTGPPKTIGTGQSVAGKSRKFHRTFSKTFWSFSATGKFPAESKLPQVKVSALTSPNSLI